MLGPEETSGPCTMASTSESQGILNAGGIQKRWSEAVEEELIKKETN